MTGVGRAPRDRVLSTAGAQAGNHLVLTKAAGLEGTHILANDFAARLTGVPSALLEEARAYASELSVVPEAGVAADLGATALHDPTEAGVLGAVWEMAEASNTGFVVEAARIPVREPTRAICAALGADPLRLIASGALLIACPDGPGMAAALVAHRIPATVIGALTTRAAERVLVQPSGAREPIDQLGRDELYRLLEQRGGPGEVG
jgi:hydrogenase maturation factor